MIAWWWIPVVLVIGVVAGYALNGVMKDGSDFDDMEESFWKGVEYGWVHPDCRTGGKV